MRAFAVCSLALVLWACDGKDDPGQNNPTTGSPGTATGTATGTPTATGTATGTGTGTGGTASQACDGSLCIVWDPDDFFFTHQIGVDPCPNVLGEVTIDNGTTDQANWSVIGPQLSGGTTGGTGSPPTVAPILFDNGGIGVAQIAGQVPAGGQVAVTAQFGCNIGSNFQGLMQAQAQAITGEQVQQGIQVQGQVQ